MGHWSPLYRSTLVWSTLFAVSRESVYVCEITGSTKYHTTWLHLISGDSYDPSPLEEFIRSEYPGILRHKWVWANASEENLFGSPLLLDDSFRGTGLLAEYVRGGIFASLSGREKMKVYNILAWASDWLSDEGKKKMYSKLLNMESDNAMHSS